MKILSFLLLIIVASFTSCKKESAPDISRQNSGEYRAPRIEEDINPIFEAMQFDQDDSDGDIDNQYEPEIVQPFAMKFAVCDSIMPEESPCGKNPTKKYKKRAIINNINKVRVKLTGWGFGKTQLQDSTQIWASSKTLGIDTFPLVVESWGDSTIVVLFPAIPTTYKNQFSLKFQIKRFVREPNKPLKIRLKTKAMASVNMFYAKPYWCSGTLNASYYSQAEALDTIQKMRIDIGLPPLPLEQSWSAITDSYRPQAGDLLTSSVVGSFDAQKFVLVYAQHFERNGQIGANVFSGAQPKGSNLGNEVFSVERPFSSMSVKFGQMQNVALYRR